MGDRWVKCTTAATNSRDVFINLANVIMMGRLAVSGEESTRINFVAGPEIKDISVREKPEEILAMKTL